VLADQRESSILEALFTADWWQLRLRVGRQGRPGEGSGRLKPRLVIVLRWCLA